ncbi:MAG: hypothetical protein OEY38_01290 [Gammaproteobacteria bacterium]|nr:hypothetical protein [Gammaproteobacteria bacterium]
MKSYKLVSAAISVLVLLSACSSSDNDPAGSGKTLTSFYLAFFDASNDMKMLNPSAPSTIVDATEADGSTNFKVSSTATTTHNTFEVSVPSAKYNTGVLSNIHINSRLFTSTASAKSGKLLKMNAIASGSSSVSQISSELNACSGSFDIFPDYANVANSVIVYESDVTNTCGGSGTDMFTSLGAADTDAPVSAYKPVAAIYESTGAISMFLIENSNFLQSVTSLDTSNTASDLTPSVAVSSKVDLVGRSSNGDLIFLIDDTTLWHVNSSTLAATEITTPNVNTTATNFMSDGTYLYWSRSATLGVYRVKLDGSETTSTLMLTPQSTILSGNLYLTSNHVVYTNGNNIYSFAKTTIDGIELDDATELTDGSAQVIDISTGEISAVIGDWIYFGYLADLDMGGSANDMVAAKVKADNTSYAAYTGDFEVSTVTIYGTASWVGATTSTSKTFGQAIQGADIMLATTIGVNASNNMVYDTNVTSYNGSLGTLNGLVTTIVGTSATWAFDKVHVGSYGLGTINIDSTGAHIYLGSSSALTKVYDSTNATIEEIIEDDIIQILDGVQNNPFGL